MSQQSNSKPYDYLIVGAGLFGSVVAYRATQAGKRVKVVDRRDHIGGNLYCVDSEGIAIHRYGAHIFHTSDKQVWQWVNSIVEFVPYINSPVANYKGRLYNLPFNMNTFCQLWGDMTPAQAKAKIEQQRAEYGTKEPQNLEQQAISLVGTDIYHTLVKGYTEKQWGRSCSELDPSIIRRLPVRFTFDNNYFNDTYQGIPRGGYNQFITKLLEGAEVELNCDFFASREALESQADKIVYTGEIDRYFDYCFGALEYRTLRFEDERIESENYQGVAVMNFTDLQTPYTRIIEHRHFDRSCTAPHTVITREYPEEWSAGSEPYYPIGDTRNTALAEQYRALAADTKGVIFGGRLAEYRYYDMHQIVKKALEVEL
ncbi:MAG: UDP-galactopyranose mutase [Alistipes sp.]|nr:UDP-galactopyranose mutase [Alistipes sp.]